MLGYQPKVDEPSRPVYWIFVTTNNWQVVGLVLNLSLHKGVYHPAEIGCKNFPGGTFRPKIHLGSTFTQFSLKVQHWKGSLEKIRGQSDKFEYLVGLTKVAYRGRLRGVTI